MNAWGMESLICEHLHPFDASIIFRASVQLNIGSTWSNSFAGTILVTIATFTEPRVSIKEYPSTRET